MGALLPFLWPTVGQDRVKPEGLNHAKSVLLASLSWHESQQHDLEACDGPDMRA